MAALARMLLLAAPAFAGPGPRIDLALEARAFGLAWTPPAVAVPAPRLEPQSPAPSAPLAVDGAGTLRSWDDALDELAAARIVAVGEKHDARRHHEAQAEVLRALAARVPQLAVGLEMVSYDQQPVLDAFQSGAMSEAQFAGWWKSVWGLDYALYEPVFREAKAAGARLFALNAPLSLVRQVAKGGLASLSPSERGQLPASIRESDDARYRDFVLISVEAHGPMTPEQVARQLEAMSVWNETMGERAAALAAPGRVVLVIAGQGHLFYRAGLIESALRRGAGPAKVLLPYPLDGSAPPASEQLRTLRDPANGELELADWFRLAP